MKVDLLVNNVGTDRHSGVGFGHSTITRRVLEQKNIHTFLKQHEKFSGGLKTILKGDREILMDYKEGYLQSAVVKKFEKKNPTNIANEAQINYEYMPNGKIQTVVKNGEKVFAGLYFPDENISGAKLGGERIVLHDTETGDTFVNDTWEKNPEIRKIDSIYFPMFYTKDESGNITRICKSHEEDKYADFGKYYFSTLKHKPTGSYEIKRRINQKWNEETFDENFCHYKECIKDDNKTKFINASSHETLYHDNTIFKQLEIHTNCKKYGLNIPGKYGRVSFMHPADMKNIIVQYKENFFTHQDVAIFNPQFNEILESSHLLTNKTIKKSYSTIYELLDKARYCAKAFERFQDKIEKLNIGISRIGKKLETLDRPSSRVLN